MVDGNKSTRHSNALECRYAVLTAVMNDHKCKNPRPRSGMDYIRGVLRGSHLLAHTWAKRAVQHGVFFTCSLIKKRPLSWKFTSLYHGRGLKVDRQTDVFRKSVAWAASFCSAGCLHRFVRAGLQECKHFIIFYLGCLTFGKNGV